MPTRTISFTTNEGTYMNLDVSPDGKMLIFDLLGDLFTLPITGGKATQISRGISLNLRPVFSPDGKRIAYISDISGSFHLNIRDIPGTFHIVLGKSEPEMDFRQDAVWMPDGKYISIADSVYSLTGSNISAQSTFKHVLRFSANGDSVYYLDSNKVYRYDFANGNKTALSSISNCLNGTLAPNGRWWAYVTDSNSNRCLIVKDLLNNSDRILVASFLEKDSHYRYKSYTSSRNAFSPDSKFIFISYGGKIHRIDVENGSDHIVPFNVRVKIELGSYNYNKFRISHDSFEVKYTRSANASPDGKYLVFSALNRLYLKNLPNGEAHILVPQTVSQFQPVYSPDGRWIAYVTWSDTAGGYLWKVSAHGGQPQQITYTPGNYQRPTWSPDSKLIAVIKSAPMLGDRDDEGIGELQLFSIYGGPPRVIEDSLPLWNQLEFSIDGNSIIYQPKCMIYDGLSLVPQLVSKDLNGKNLKVLNVGVNLPFLQQRKLSQNRRFIVYSAGEDLYLLPLCKLTTPETIYNEKQRLPVIKFAAGVDPNWEKGGEVISWTYGNKFYRVNPDKIVAAAERIFEKRQSLGLPEIKDITAIVKPDQVIDLSVKAPAFYAHGVIAFRNVRIITMHGNEVIEHGTIVINDGRFTDIGPSEKIQIPRGAKLFDLPGSTIMPGLVDVHLHMRVPSDIFPQQSWMFLTNLAYGVTTARDPSQSFDSYGYKELVASGQMIGPRLYTVGRAARIPDGMVRCNNIEDAFRLSKKRAVLGGTVVKQYMLPTRIQRQWLLLACKKSKLNMTNEGGFDPILQLGMIKDGSTGIEHNPTWGEVYKDIIYFIATSGIFLTPTLQVCNGEEMAKEYFKRKYWSQPDKKLMHFMYSYASQTGPTFNGAESIETILNAHPKDTVNPGFIIPAMIDARIHEQGGRIALGSHGNDEGIGAHNELWALQMGGLNNLDVLRIGTLTGAKALGIQKDIGSIEVGKIADLIVLNKNPLENIQNSIEIHFVMKDGVLYNGDTLDEIWPNFKKCPLWKPNQMNDK